MKIADIEIPSNVILAPMAGVTDLAYRTICRENGCECAVTEMINARALSYENKTTLQMLATNKQDKPLGIQLVGSEDKYFIEAIERLEKIDYDFLDLNSACPVKKVINNAEGSSLMRDPLRLASLIKTMIKYSQKPVTVKIRAGWCEDSKNAVEISKLAEDCGASAVFIHGRTRMQHYAGEVDRDIIAAVKQGVSIPVVASGDIFTVNDVKNTIDETGVDGVLVARGSYGNPWIFEQIKAYMNNGTMLPLPNVDIVADMMIYHLDKICDLYGNEYGPCIYRKVFVWYTKGFQHTKDLRQKVFTLRNRDEIVNVIEEFRTNAVRIKIN